MNGDYAMVALLRDNPSVANLVGGTGVNNARIFISDAPQKARLPFIVCDVYDVEPFDSKDGVSTTDHDLVKVFVYAEKSSDAIALNNAVRQNADEARGNFNDQQVINIRFLRNDGYNIDLENRKVYVRESDYQVRIRVNTSTGNNWVLKTGIWNDTAYWDDAAIWKD